MEVNHGAPVVASDQIGINADPATVWGVISAIDAWPRWNPAIKTASLKGPLAEGTMFRWKAGPGMITSTLRQVSPPQVLAWTGKTMGIKAIHVYRLKPRQGGTVVHTAESWGHPCTPAAPARGPAAGPPRIAGPALTQDQGTMGVRCRPADVSPAMPAARAHIAPRGPARCPAMPVIPARRRRSLASYVHLHVSRNRPLRTICDHLAAIRPADYSRLSRPTEGCGLEARTSGSGPSRSQGCANAPGTGSFQCLAAGK